MSNLSSHVFTLVQWMFVLFTCQIMVLLVQKLKKVSDLPNENSLIFYTCWSVAKQRTHTKFILAYIVFVKSKWALWKNFSNKKLHFWSNCFKELSWKMIKKLKKYKMALIIWLLFFRQTLLFGLYVCDLNIYPHFNFGFSFAILI